MTDKPQTFDVPLGRLLSVAPGLLRAVKRGDAKRLTLTLRADPGLASSWIGGCTPLHHFADARQRAHSGNP